MNGQDPIRFVRNRPAAAPTAGGDAACEGADLRSRILPGRDEAADLVLLDDGRKGHKDGFRVAPHRLAGSTDGVCADFEIVASGVVAVDPTYPLRPSPQPQPQGQTPGAAGAAGAAAALNAAAVGAAVGAAAAAQPLRAMVPRYLNLPTTKTTADDWVVVMTPELQRPN